MTDPRPTQPLPDGGRPPAPDAGGTGCRHGHGQPRNPTYHPRWGLVPSMSNAILGAVTLVAAVGLAWWLLPDGWWIALVGLALLGLAASAAIQAALGHRGRCWVQRTLRWWLGPLGAFWDPVDAG